MVETQSRRVQERTAQPSDGCQVRGQFAPHAPVQRVTDHRVGITIPLREQVLQGSLGDITSALAAEERRLRLEEQAG